MQVSMVVQMVGQGPLATKSNQQYQCIRYKNGGRWNRHNAKARCSCPSQRPKPLPIRGAKCSPSVRASKAGTLRGPKEIQFRYSLKITKSYEKTMVRPRGLEPPRCYPLAPQASASTNSAMAARHIVGGAVLNRGLPINQPLSGRLAKARGGECFATAADCI